MKGTKRAKTQPPAGNPGLQDRSEVAGLRPRGRKSNRDKIREDRYRAILDGITEGYYEVDLAGNITFFNAALCRMLNRTPSKLLGMDYPGCLVPGDAEKVRDLFRRVLGTGEAEKGFDCEFTRRDGSRSPSRCPSRSSGMGTVGRRDSGGLCGTSPPEGAPRRPCAEARSGIASSPTA